MHKINRKFALTLALLLVLSQWLSLAHATDHLIESGNSHCQICTLQHHFHSTAVNTTSTCLTHNTSNDAPDSWVILLYTTTPESTHTIRAPPLHPLI